MPDNKKPESRNESEYSYSKDKARYLSDLEPTFLKMIAEAKSMDDPVFDGIRQGYADYLKEQKDLDNSRLPDWLQRDRLTKAFNDKTRQPEPDKNKGNEPEK